MQQSVFSLDNKNIIITGASSGIGRACAVECSKAGAKVFLIARDQCRLNDTIQSLDGNGHLGFSFDLSEIDKISQFLNEQLKNFLPIHGLIHCAGIENTIPIQFLDERKYMDLYRINVIAGFELAKLISKKPNFNSIQGASLIFISSVMGFLGQDGKIAYSATKGALIAGVKSMAIELAKKSIRVNSVSPGIVETEMTRRMFDSLPVKSLEMIKGMHPMGFGRTEDIAYSCIYLLSDASRWITGTNLIIDGGYSAK